MKKEFHVRVKQVVEENYIVEASSEEEAYKIAEDKYNSGEFDPIKTSGDINHSIGIHDENENGHIYYLKKVLRDLNENKIFLNDLLVVGAIEWMLGSAEELKIDSKIMKDYSDLILSIASDKFLKSNTGEYFSNVDTATAGAYLACYAAHKFKVDAYEALSWMLKNDVFLGCEDDSVRCLFSFDEDKFEKEFVNAISKQNHRNVAEVSI